MLHTCTPGGKKGKEPGARMMFFAVKVLPVSTAFTVLAPASSPVASTTSTPSVFSEPCRSPRREVHAQDTPRTQLSHTWYIQINAPSQPLSLIHI